MASAQVLETDKQQLASPLGIFELPPAEENPGYNRRSLPRVAGRFVVEALEDGERYKGLDLSFGGLMCTCTSPVWPGNRLWLRLHLTGQKAPIDIQGEVVDLVPHGNRIAMRIRFHDAAPAERKAIARWMAAEAR